MIKKIQLLLFFAGSSCLLPAALMAQPGNPAYCAVTLKFVHSANGKKILKNDSTYTTPNGEPYTISKLKYYTSDLHFKEKKTGTFLIDAFGCDSADIFIPPGIYKSFSFLLGVDSLHNSSGAQDGALDPLNDMFWTWNSGYVMFKLEGKSGVSTADLQRIEHHIGGYQGEYKTMRTIQINFKDEIHLSRGKNATIVIEMDLDKYWNGISIVSTPVIVTPGGLAKRSADNFSSMFKFKEVIYR
jgi:hypothetical protein